MVTYQLYGAPSRAYAPPAQLDAREPYGVVVKSFGPSVADTANRYFVRGVEVQRLFVVNDRGHLLCVFPNGRQMYVNPQNLQRKPRSATN